MYYYFHKCLLFISNIKRTNPDFAEVDEKKASEYNGLIYAFTEMPPEKSNLKFLVPREDYLFLKHEDISFLSSIKQSSFKAPLWLNRAISENRVISLNTRYPDYLEAASIQAPKKWRIHVAGLGDVGSTLLTGLRLLGVDCINELGIYDLDKNKVKRLDFELSQIMSCSGKERSIKIKTLDEASLFDCDMFIFCVSVYVPPIGESHSDVRLVQFDGNRKVLNYYGELARRNNYKGLFAVVSDPVDLLCRSLFEHTNRDEEGCFDFKGLAPEQIRGYGLGVMNARAAYYAGYNKETELYYSEGRAFGPHGEGLIIANSIENYDETASDYLTEKTKKANLDIRETGFKPYIAPALSSGALSILDTIRGKSHYSACFIDGIYMGCRNRYINGCTIHELANLPEPLFNKVKHTFNLLDDIYKSY